MVKRNDVNRRGTRWGNVKETPHNPASALARQGLKSGTPVRCPGCECMTLLGHLQEGCPACGYAPRRKKDLARNAVTVQNIRADVAAQLSAKEFGKAQRQWGRFVA